MSYSFMAAFLGWHPVLWRRHAGGKGEAMIRLGPLAAADPRAAEALLDRAFGPGRLQRTAALVRRGADPIADACLAAHDVMGLLVGSIAVHRVGWLADDGSVQPLAWLGPLAREPARQGEGIGVLLMEAALTLMDRLPLDVALIGDAPYYGRWGFRADATARWRLPGPVAPDRLLLRSTNPARWDRPATLGALPLTAAPA